MNNKKTLFLMLLLLSLCLLGCISSSDDKKEEEKHDDASKIDEVVDIEDEKEKDKEDEPSIPDDPPEAEIVYKNIYTNIDSLKLIENKKAQILASTVSFQPVYGDLIFTVTSGSDIISVNEDGLVTAIKAGNAEVTISSKKGYYNNKIIPVTVIKESEDIDLAFPYVDEDILTYSDLSSFVAPAIGNQKILVIPFCLPNDKKIPTEENLSIIKKAYSGTREECGWRSLKDYFYEASFGKLIYDITVPNEWFILPDEYENDSVDNLNVTKIAPLALKWYIDNNPNVDISSFDNNNDGYVDNFHLIYGGNASVTGFTTRAFDDVNVDTVKVGNFVYTKLSIMKDTSNLGGVPSNGINTRVIIHENGHMLGLLDYYDNSFSGINLLGSYDMQDNDMMDWNIFSKFAVGWVKPRYVNLEYLATSKSATITLNSSVLNGDALIIKNSNYLGHAFDEYIIIELFNPDAGNNYYDTHFSLDFDTRKIGYGVKIYHVDARLIQSYWIDAVNASITEFVTRDTTIKDNSVIQVFSSNTAKKGRYPENYPWNELDEDAINFYLIHLLQKGNVNTFTEGKETSRNKFNNDDLWQTGDTFTIGDHEGYTDYGKNFFYYEDTFNDKTTFPFGVIFEEVTKDTVTITINYLG